MFCRLPWKKKTSRETRPHLGLRPLRFFRPWVNAHLEFQSPKCLGCLTLKGNRMRILPFGLPGKNEQRCPVVIDLQGEINKQKNISAKGRTLFRGWCLYDPWRRGSLFINQVVMVSLSGVQDRVSSMAVLCFCRPAGALMECKRLNTSLQDLHLSQGHRSRSSCLQHLA